MPLNGTRAATLGAEDADRLRSIAAQVQALRRAAARLNRDRMLLAVYRRPIGLEITLADFGLASTLLAVRELAESSRWQVALLADLAGVHLDAFDGPPEAEAEGTRAEGIDGRLGRPLPAAAGPADRLAFDMAVSTDSPVVRGTRVTVERLVRLIVDGWTWADVLRAKPEITEEDLRAALAYAVGADRSATPAKADQADMTLSLAAFEAACADVADGAPGRSAGGGTVFCPCAACEASRAIGLVPATGRAV